MLRALGVDGRGYVLADRSCKLSPAGGSAGGRFICLNNFVVRQIRSVAP